MRYYLIIASVLFLGCEIKEPKKIRLDYKAIGSSDYSPSQKYDLRKNQLVIAFASNFEKDTIEIEYNNIDTTGIITTDEVTGLAWDLRLGEIKDSLDLKLTINDFETVEFNVNKTDQLFLVELYDSTLFIKSLYYLPAFY